MVVYGEAAKYAPIGSEKLLGDNLVDVDKQRLELMDKYGVEMQVLSLTSAGPQGTLPLCVILTQASPIPRKQWTWLNTQMTFWYPNACLRLTIGRRSRQESRSFRCIRISRNARPQSRRRRSPQSSQRIKHGRRHHQRLPTIHRPRRLHPNALLRPTRIRHLLEMCLRRTQCPRVHSSSSRYPAAHEAIPRGPKVACCVGILVCEWGELTFVGAGGEWGV